MQDDNFFNVRVRIEALMQFKRYYTVKMRLSIENGAIPFTLGYCPIVYAWIFCILFDHT